jgi:hypothetical protein
MMHNRCSEYGGRVVLVTRKTKRTSEEEEDDDDDEDTFARRKNPCLLLLDVGCWTDNMTMCVANRFPGVETMVQQSRNSLTGFCVVLTLPPPVSRKKKKKGNTKVITNRAEFVKVCLLFAMSATAAVLAVAAAFRSMQLYGFVG